MTLPDFLVIGAGRAGTTSVYHYLHQHPEIFMSPIKETNFFAYLAHEKKLEKSGRPPGFPIRSFKAYEKLFEQGRRSRAIGEASPCYLTYGGTAQCIRRHLPEVRLIAILRNPVERAYSNFLFHTRDRRETRTFERAIEDELSSSGPGDLEWGPRRYVRVGYYHRSLKLYFKLFPRERIAVFLFDELRRDPVDLLRRFFVFLDVKPSFCPDVRTVYNKSGIQKSRLIRLILRKQPIKTRIRRSLPRPLQKRAVGLVEALRRHNLQAAPPMREETRRSLAARYRSDIEQLAELIDRDLSAWLQ